MDRNDQQAIEGLFGKLAEVERQSPPRDVEAERYIHDQFARQPGAPYYMAQTIVVQEQALNAAQARIAELEHEASSRRPSGGLLSGLFGDSRRPSRPSGSVPPVGQQQAYGAQQPFGYGQQPQRAGGGFLAGAAQTAMGVAGGVLLGNMIGGMFGGNEAQASESQPDDAQAQDAGFDDGGFDDGEM